MKRYDYMVDDYEGEYSREIQQRVFRKDDLAKRLRGFGDDGWELVHMYETRDKVRSVLRRELP